MTLLLALSANANAFDISSDKAVAPGLETRAPDCSILAACDRSTPKVDTELRGPADIDVAPEDLDARMAELEARVLSMTLQNTRQARRLKALEKNAQRDDKRIDDLTAKADILAQRADELAQENRQQDQRMSALADAIQEIHEHLRPVYDVMQFVKADVQRRTVSFVGANVFIQSGAGVTHDAGAGFGNLVIGYDENDGQDRKMGAHNLIVGPGHSYEGAGMIVGGADNVAEADGTMVLGAQNAALGLGSSILGGQHNTAVAPWSAILGGAFGVTEGDVSTVLGGEGAIADEAFQIAD